MTEVAYEALSDDNIDNDDSDDGQSHWRHQTWRRPLSQRGRLTRPGRGTGPVARLPTRDPVTAHSTPQSLSSSACASSLPPTSKLSTWSPCGRSPSWLGVKHFRRWTKIKIREFLCEGVLLWWEGAGVSASFVHMVLSYLRWEYIWEVSNILSDRDKRTWLLLLLI